MSLDSTLLEIRREFSKDEKYKLFLKHLDNIETELYAERKRGTELIKQNIELVKESKKLLAKNVELKEEIETYIGNKAHQKFVKLATHEKLQKAKVMYEQRFWEQNKLLNALQSSQQNDDSNTLKEISDAEFNELLFNLSEKNWKVKNLLEHFKTFNKMPKAAKLLIDGELKVMRLEKIYIK